MIVEDRPVEAKRRQLNTVGQSNQGVQAEGGVARLIQDRSPWDEDLTPLEFEY